MLNIPQMVGEIGTLALFVQCVVRWGATGARNYV